MTTLAYHLRSFVGREQARPRRSPRGTRFSLIDLLEGRRLLTSLVTPPSPPVVGPLPLASLGPGRDLVPTFGPGASGPLSDRELILADLLGDLPGPRLVPVVGPTVRPAVVAPRITLAGLMTARLSSSGLPQPTAPTGPGQPPPGRRPEISGAMLNINGTPTSEVALVNESAGKVTVMEGSSVVFTVSGLIHPEAVKLADLTNDGTPDLIIADSGRNRVLVYAGVAGGGFGPELSGGVGYAVGTDPVSLTVGDLDHDGAADLVVANKGSNDVSILASHGSGSAWSLTAQASVQTGSAPVRTAIIDPLDGSPGPYLVVCNSGSGDVYCYKTTDEGTVAADPFQVIPVGKDPSDMFLGRFGRRPEVDLVTLNGDSDKVTFVGDIFSPNPIRQEITAGIGNLTSALALNVGTSGSSDLMVTNSSGQIAFLQAGDTGLELAGLSTFAGLSQVNALALGEITSGGFEIYETSTNLDSVAVLQFDLGDASAFKAPASPSNLPVLASDSSGSLVVELIPAKVGSLDLLGFLWQGSSSLEPADDLTDGRPPSRMRAATQGLAFSGQGDGSADIVQPSSRLEDETGPDLAEPSASWTRFVFGLDAALDSFQGEVAAIAEPGSWEGPVDRSLGRRMVDRVGPRPDPAESELRASAFDPVGLGADREVRNDQRTRKFFDPFARPAIGDEGNVSSNESSELATAALGSAVAVRLLINASPPRPPQRNRRTFRARSSFGFAGRWPEIFPPMSPHG